GLDPARAELLRQGASREVEPGLVEVHRLPAQAGHPNEDGRVVGERSEALLARAEHGLDPPLRFELAMLFLRPLAVGDVPADRLVLDDGAGIVEEAAGGPVLPARLSGPGRRPLEFARRERPIGGDRLEELPDLGMMLGRKDFPQRTAEELLDRASEITAD